MAPNRDTVNVDEEASADADAQGAAAGLSERPVQEPREWRGLSRRASSVGNDEEIGSRTDFAPRRCVNLREHYDRLRFFGWCPCGYDGCPRSAAEYGQRTEAWTPGAGIPSYTRPEGAS